MSTHLLLEAAIRTLVMAAIILVALRVLRIEQVRARRTAWLLALAGALAMPLLVAAHIGPRLLPEIPFAKQPIEAEARVPHSNAGGGLQSPPVGAPNAHWIDRGASTDYSSAGADQGDGSTQYGDSALSLAVFGYCIVAAVLALRLCAGVGFALLLRNRAERVVFPFDPQLDTRASARLATPVTIASSVLLPRSFTLWDGATLRVVLSHERAHVRQRDFYVHLLARLHCALFWFNPFSWWLQRQLSELGEALSDCAAVEQAESRASYAETLLAFATREKWPLTGVAMASSSNLTPRIERLLSDQRFESSFAPKQRLPVIAAGVVMIALVAATSTVRVNASPAALSGAADTTGAIGPSTSSISSISAAPADNAVAANDATPPDNAVPANPSATAPGAHPAKKKVVKIKKVLEEGADDSVAVVTHEDVDRIAKDSADEEVLAIRSGDSHIMIDGGKFFGLHAPSGDYIYFQHNGKPYLLQDPKIIAQAQALLAPTKEIREKQRDLGNQRRILHEQERVLASQERSFSRERTDKMLQSPEFKREMEELRKRMKEIDLPQLTAQIDERALADVQAHLAEIQSQVGRLQFEIGFKGQAFSDMAKFGEQMGKLGEEQGKLGEAQAKLGEEQRKIVEDSLLKLKPLIEQAVREGTATPISK